MKDYAQAFDSYRLANELAKRYGVRHDRQQLTRLVDRITVSYDQKWLSQARIQTIRSERPVFVVGMPRSGTTLAEQILASHPAVFGAGELPFWNDAPAGYEPSMYDGTGNASMLSALADEYLRQLEELSADDATPSIPACPSSSGISPSRTPMPTTWKTWRTATRSIYAS